MKRCFRSLPALFLFLPVWAGTGNGTAHEERSVRLPLLHLKLELARENRAGFHIESKAVVVYFRGMELKRLPVVRSESWLNRPLALSRTLSLTPALEIPVLDLSGKDSLPSLDPLAHTLRLDDMPDTFEVALADGTMLFVTSDEKNLTVFCELKKGRGSPADTLLAQADQMLFLLMTADAARQFYWALRPGAGVIY